MAMSPPQHTEMVATAAAGVGVSFIFYFIFFTQLTFFFFTIRLHALEIQTAMMMNSHVTTSGAGETAERLVQWYACSVYRHGYTEF